MVNDDRDDGDQLVLPPPEPRWKLRAAVALVTAAALVWGGLTLYDYTFVRCAEGIREQGPAEECVGVTDGSFAFDETHLGEVMAKIRKENRRVERSGQPWVSVAYFEPMTLGTGDKGWESIEQELRGAYLAQVELNDHGTGGAGSVPQIKLLPANPGHGSGQWEVLVEQLLTMTDDAHPVVAVAGFGQSLATTSAAVDRLRAEGVPMVGSTVTADSLSDRRQHGFFRAVSPNADQSSAVAKHLAARQKKHPDFRVQVIKDINRNDIYSTSLREGFHRAARESGLDLDRVEVPFVSKSDAVSNALASVADKICRQSELPDAVYFAGRGRDLKGFIEAAAANGRSCPVTIYTGDDAVGMFFDIPRHEKPEEHEQFRSRWHSSAVEVRFTALAHPSAADDIYPDTEHNAYDAFRDSYEETFGDARGLLNGQSMLGHDAMLTVGTAIRNAAGEQGTGQVDTGTVRDLLVQLNGPDAVPGVSGPIDFDDAGNPKDKPLPLVELLPQTPEQKQKRVVYAYRQVLAP